MQGLSIQIDKFDLWRYHPTSANCWHFVRDWVIEKGGIPPSAVPLSDALPMHFGDITKDFESIKGKFYKVEKPHNHCIAMQFIGRHATHVGVVYNNHVYHVSHESTSRLKDTKTKFERRARRTEYYSYAGN